MANRSAHLWFGGVWWRWPCVVVLVLTHRGDALPGEGLGEADRVARGLADVCVVQKPVNGRGREAEVFASTYED
jgi:hypothetical protein